jgi:spermidine/putrescine transport system substrate-binding protein
LSARPYTAEVFINYLLRPEVAAQVTNYTRFASPVEAAEEFVAPDILGDEAIYPSPPVRDRLEWIQDVGAAGPVYDRIWMEVSAK